MKNICLHFQIHQPILLRRYRFFDIATSHYYYDDYANQERIQEVTERSYVPALTTLLDLCRRSDGFFRFSVGLSGVAADQLESHAPEVLDLLKELSRTGCCEFVAVPYSYGLSSLFSPEVFRDQMRREVDRLTALFGTRPVVMANTDLLYDDEIGQMVLEMGFKGILTEGAKHVLGWKSPHYLYSSSLSPKLGVLLRDFKLSDDISLRFSNPEWNEYPLMADKYMGWIESSPQDEQIFNVFMNLEALGISQPLSSHILDFLSAFPSQARSRGLGFMTPREALEKLKPVGMVDVPYPMTWNDEERDTSSLVGNSMQREAVQKLYSVADRVLLCQDRRIKLDFDFLQSGDNFRMMTTKCSGVGMDRSFYESPFDAFTNYMNILGDFIKRVDSLYPSDVDNEELNALLTTIRNQDSEIQSLRRQIEKSKEKLDEKEEAPSQPVRKRSRKTRS